MDLLPSEDNPILKRLQQGEDQPAGDSAMLLTQRVETRFNFGLKDTSCGEITVAKPADVTSEGKLSSDTDKKTPDKILTDMKLIKSTTPEALKSASLQHQPSLVNSVGKNFLDSTKSKSLLEDLAKNHLNTVQTPLPDLVSKLSLAPPKLQSDPLNHSTVGPSALGNLAQSHLAASDVPPLSGILETGKVTKEPGLTGLSLLAQNHLSSVGPSTPTLGALANGHLSTQTPSSVPVSLGQVMGNSSSSALGQLANNFLNESPNASGPVFQIPSLFGNNSSSELQSFKSKPLESADIDLTVALKKPSGQEEQDIMMTDILPESDVATPYLNIEILIPSVNSLQSGLLQTERSTPFGVVICRKWKKQKRLSLKVKASPYQHCIVPFQFDTKSPDDNVKSAQAAVFKRS